MEHIRSFTKSKQRLNVIAVFMTILVILGLLSAAATGRVFFKFIWSAAVFTALHQIFQGRKWAVNLVVIVSVISILQGVLALSNVRGAGHLFYVLFMIGAFGYIIWFFTQSKDFANYVRLKEAGVGQGTTGDVREVYDIVEREKTVAFAHREITNMEDYLDLSRQLLSVAGLEEYIELIAPDEDHAHQLIVETQETRYVLEINRRLNIFDRKFIDRFNNMLEDMGAERFYYFIQPQSVLWPDPNHTQVALATPEQFAELVEAGFAVTR
jgi:hypothetical protein